MENTKKYVVIKTLNEKMVLILIYNYKVNYKNKTNITLVCYFFPGI